MKRLVLDSNIVLLDANNILTLGKDAIVVLAETVVAECDNKKSGFGELAYQARQMGRIIACCDLIGTDFANGMVLTTLLHKSENVTIEIVTLDKYENIDINDSGANDQKIIQVVQAVDKNFGDTVFMTNDMLARVRALALGLKTIDLKLVNDEEFEFVKEFLVKDPEVFRTLHNTSIFTVDPDYSLENYSYKFTCNISNQMKLATISNGFINVLGKETEDKLKLQDAAPINVEQLLMSKAVQDNSIDIVIVEAKSGSGKTVCALSNAIRLMKTNKDKYDGIVYIRNSVDDIGNKDEEIGFLSGNSEKEAIYLHPLEDTLEFLVRKKLDKKSCSLKDVESKVTDNIRKLRDSYNIQGRIAIGLRGRTLHNVIVIIDEAQNISVNTMQKILTRIGKDSKVIVIGSQSQIDSVYLNRYNNGLSILMNECVNRTLSTDVGMFAIKLTKVLRSKMSEFAEDLFSS